MDLTLDNIDCSNDYPRKIFTSNIFYNGPTLSCITGTEKCGLTLNQLLKKICTSINELTGFENIEDIIAEALVDSDTIDFTYNDTLNQITASVITQLSITSDSGGIKLVNDQAAPGINRYYGFNAVGTGPAYWPLIIYTDEMAQDTIFNALIVRNALTPTYDDFANTYLVELGGSLVHDTTIETGLYKLILSGNTIYDYPYQIRSLHEWRDGSGLMSWKGVNKLFTNSVANPDNLVRIGMNYVEQEYLTAVEAVGVGGVPIPGFLGNTFCGYGLITNITSHGSYGTYADEITSKTVGIGFHTKDTAHTDGITIYAAPTTAINNNAGTLTLADMSPYSVAMFRTNGDVRFPFYPNTRNDSAASNFLFTDANGVLQSGNVAGIGGAPAFTAFSPLVYNAGTGDLTFNQMVDLDNNARVGVRHNSGSTIKRRRVNFVDTTSVILSISDVPGSEEITVLANLVSLPFNKIEIRFEVGDVDFPGNDTNTFNASTLPSPINLINKKIVVYREGERMYPDTVFGIAYNSGTGVITFYPNLATGEKIIIEVEPLDYWSIVEGIPNPGFPYILSATLS